MADFRIRRRTPHHHLYQPVRGSSSTIRIAGLLYSGCGLYECGCWNAGGFPIRSGFSAGEIFNAPVRRERVSSRRVLRGPLRGVNLSFRLVGVWFVRSSGDGRDLAVFGYYSLDLERNAYALHLSSAWERPRFRVGPIGDDCARRLEHSNLLRDRLNSSFLNLGSKKKQSWVAHDCSLVMASSKNPTRWWMVKIPIW